MNYASYPANPYGYGGNKPAPGGNPPDQPAAPTPYRPNTAMPPMGGRYLPPKIGPEPTRGGAVGPTLGGSNGPRPGNPGVYNPPAYDNPRKQPPIVPPMPPSGTYMGPGRQPPIVPQPSPMQPTATPPYRRAIPPAYGGGNMATGPYSMPPLGGIKPSQPLGNGDDVIDPIIPSRGLYDGNPGYNPGYR